MNTRGTFELFDAAIPLKEDNLFVFYDSNTNTYKNIRLSDMYEDIYETFIETQRISSMAFETSSDYAASIHDHDNYNYASLSSVQKGFPIVDIIDGNNIMTLRLKNASQVGNDTMNKIGFIKISKCEMTNIDIFSESFDGWVYADGQTYDFRQFKYGDQLSTIFKTQGFHFKVPEISGDVQINNDMKSSGCIRCIKDDNFKIFDQKVNYMVYIGKTC